LIDRQLTLEKFAASVFGIKPLYPEDWRMQVPLKQCYLRVRHSLFWDVTQHKWIVSYRQVTLELW